MTTEDASRANEKISIELQNKYHFYALGLSFTVLALAVETAKFGQSVIADRIELVGWIALLVSGLAGLSHMEWFAPLYSYFATESELEKNIRDLKVAEATRPGVSIHNLKTNKVETSGENIDRATKSLAVVKQTRGRLQRSLLLKFRLMKYGFTAGVVCLMIARGWAPLSTTIASVAAAIGKN